MNSLNSRLYSLDVFRGMTIALMILVNIPGSWNYIYPPFEHADWNGCTPTDLVFPFFLFIVGVSSAFSFLKFDYKLNYETAFKIIERTFLIFTIGLLLNYFPFFNYFLTGADSWGDFITFLSRFILAFVPFFIILWLLKSITPKIAYLVSNKKTGNLTYLLSFIVIYLIILLISLLIIDKIPVYNKELSDLRILGVLQRIALAYGFGVLLILSFRKKKNIYIFGVLLLFFYWLIMWYFGGVNSFSLEGNFERKIDIFVLGENHMWHGKNIAFDPEGILSTIPSVVTVLIGFLTGNKLIEISKKTYSQILIQLIIAGVILVGLGLIWNIFFPINKSLWTSSYVLFTGGLAMIFLSCLYWLIDVKDQSKWFSFFNVFGVNPLFAFVVHVLWVKIIANILKWSYGENITENGYLLLYEKVFQRFGNYQGSFLFAISHILFFYLILFILYKKKIFIKI